MSLYNGTEFDLLTGTQGQAKKLIWKAIYDKFIDYSVQIAAAVGVESAARALAIQNLQAQITGMKLVTSWNPNDPFPTKKAGGVSFESGNFVRVVASANGYKAGDMLIAFADIPGDAVVTDFGDVETNIELATATFAGAVKILADKAAYEGAGNDTSVVTKVVLQQVLQAFGSQITTAFETADTALQQTITTAYETAISTALANYYSKTAIDNLLSGKAGNDKLEMIVNYMSSELWGAIANTLQKIPQISREMSALAATPTLDTSLIARSSVGQRPFLYFTKEGFKLKGKDISSAIVDNANVSWADITDPNKDLYDYFLIRSTTSHLYTTLFNPNVFTQEEVKTLTVSQIIYGGSISTETAMGAFVLENPYDKTRVGKYDATSVQKLSDLFTYVTAN
jgi:hypothetical protein